MPAAVSRTISAECKPTPFARASEAARNPGRATHGLRTSTKNASSLAAGLGQVKILRRPNFSIAHCVKALHHAPDVADEKEIRDALEREKHPERKHTRAEIRAMENALRKIYEYGDEREFMQFLRGIGLKDESPEFAAAVSVFRSLRRGKH